MKSQISQMNHRPNLTGIFNQFLEACSWARANLRLTLAATWSAVPNSEIFFSRSVLALRSKISFRTGLANPLALPNSARVMPPSTLTSPSSIFSSAGPVHKLLDAKDRPVTAAVSKIR